MCMILVEGGGIPVCRQLQRGWNNCKIKLNFIVLETLSLKVFRPEKNLLRTFPILQSYL